MKALSIHPYFAMAIAEGGKSIECRSWKTDYRGDLLICSTAKLYKGTIPSHALCIVELYDVVPFEKKHLNAALLKPADYAPGLYAWKLRNNRIIKPVPVKGKLSLWDYNGDLEIIPNDILGYVPLDELPPEETDEPPTHAQWFVENWEPLMT
jgi:hypothetical protein